MLKIVYFASLKDKIGRSEETLELPAGVENLTQLVEALSAMHGDAWSAVINGSTILSAVNHEMCEPSQTIKDGDEIAFFPPVTGG